MVDEGADILDVGGESTAPARGGVGDDEMERGFPCCGRSVVAWLSTSRSTRARAVARAALAEGADAINDVSALSDPGMASAVAESDAGLVLMHMRGTPETMQTLTGYGDVAEEVAAELEPALARAAEAGIGAERVVVDPGIGFAKTAEQNLELIARLEVLGARLGRPVLLGLPKAFLGALVGAPAARAARVRGACVAGWRATPPLPRARGPRGAAALACARSPAGGGAAHRAGASSRPGGATRAILSFRRDSACSGVLLGDARHPDPSGLVLLWWSTCPPAAGAELIVDLLRTFRLRVSRR